MVVAGGVVDGVELAKVRCEAAVDDDHVPGDVPRRRRDQVVNGPCHVVHGAEVLDPGLGDETFAEELVLRAAVDAGGVGLETTRTHAVDRDASGTELEREGAHLRKITPDPVLLFRYSAVTFNGHRIHYDADYVSNVEGYPGLIVHGPLIATFALDFIEFDLAPGRSIEKFSFRMKKPTFDYAPFHLHADASADGKGYAAWTSDNNGQVALDGEIVLA